jgi:hypothetical protein
MMSDARQRAKVCQGVGGWQTLVVRALALATVTTPARSLTRAITAPGLGLRLKNIITLDITQVLDRSNQEDGR